MFLSMVNVVLTTVAAVAIVFLLPYLLLLFAVAAGLY